jgi:signal transduction histidine kinase
VSTVTGYGQRLTGRLRGLPPTAVDAIIAVACCLNVVLPAMVDERLEWWVAALAAAGALPLLWRRRYPFLVTMIAGVLTTWMSFAHALGELPGAQLVATYTFAALCPPVQRLIAVVCTAAGVTVSILIAKDEVLNLGVVGMAFAVAYALGTGARARRDRIAMLEERAHRLAEEQDAAATRERERIAREMHDILAHSMSVIAVQAEAGPVAVRSDPDKAEEVFDTISAAAREALSQLRRALGVLRPDEPARRPQPGLDDLPALVGGLRHAGLTVTLEAGDGAGDGAGGSRPVPADLAATVYRIVQESLTNTVKHAAATEARVRLRRSDGALQVEVCDDGSGPARPGERSGHGLIGMRERVAAAGGELSFGPGPGGKGFRVTASLPLQ